MKRFFPILGYSLTNIISCVCNILVQVLLFKKKSMCFSLLSTLCRLCLSRIRYDFTVILIINSSRLYEFRGNFFLRLKSLATLFFCIFIFDGIDLIECLHFYSIAQLGVK